MIKKLYIELYTLLGIVVVLLLIACQKGQSIAEYTEKPQANFSVKQMNTVKNMYQFLNQSTNSVNVMWNMGTGIKYSAKDTVNYQFTKKGNYVVSLYALGKGGDIDSMKTTLLITEDYNPLNDSLSGGNSKAWKLVPEANALVVGPLPAQTCCPTMGNPPTYANNWWASSVQDVSTRSCTFNTTYTFNSDGTMARDIKGTFWPDPILQGYPAQATCLDANTYWTGGLSAFGNGTFTWDINIITNELTILGNGAYIGLYKVQETTDASTNPQPINKIVYKIYSITSKKIIIYKDLPSAGIANGMRWYFTLQAQ